jgi:hypothetical protein
MALEPARHMVAQNTALKVDADRAHETAGTTDSPGSTALVLNGVLQLTNNIDPSQSVPDDQPQAMFRHVNVQIRGADAGELIPYLSTSMDLLLDGRAAISNLPLEAMVAAESTPSELYYGNNLEFMQTGYLSGVRAAPAKRSAGHSCATRGPIHGRRPLIRTPIRAGGQLLAGSLWDRCRSTAPSASSASRWAEVTPRRPVMSSRS